MQPLIKQYSTACTQCKCMLTALPLFWLTKKGPTYLLYLLLPKVIHITNSLCFVAALHLHWLNLKLHFGQPWEPWAGVLRTGFLLLKSIVVFLLEKILISSL